MRYSGFKPEFSPLLGWYFRSSLSWLKAEIWRRPLRSFSAAAAVLVLVLVCRRRRLLVLCVLCVLCVRLMQFLGLRVWLGVQVWMKSLMGVVVFRDVVMTLVILSL